MVDFAINQPAHYLSNVMLHLVYIYPVQAVALLIRMLILASFIRSQFQICTKYIFKQGFIANCALALTVRLACSHHYST